MNEKKANSSRVTFRWVFLIKSKSTNANQLKSETLRVLSLQIFVPLAAKVMPTTLRECLLVRKMLI